MTPSDTPRRREWDDPTAGDDDHGVAGMTETRAMNATAYTLTGLLVCGLLGWLGDTVLGISALLPLGLGIGTAVGLVLVWVRYGKPQKPPTGSSSASGQPPGPANDGRRSRPDATTTYEEGH